MPIQKVVTKSLQCIVSLYLFIRLLCSRKGRKNSHYGHKESTCAIEDQDVSGAGHSHRDSQGRKSLVVDHEAPRKKGVNFVSTSLIVDDDTPASIPWQTTSESYGDPDAVSEKLSSHLSHSTSNRSSRDISLWSRSIYDDSSIIGLSLLFDSDEESYVDEDTTYDFFQPGFQDVFLGDPNAQWIQPVNSQWNLEVAAAMNAFRSSRVDHDDIVTAITSPGLTSEARTSVKNGTDLADASQEQQIEDWRNDFISAGEATTSTPPKDAAISDFRFPLSVPSSTLPNMPFP